MSDRIAVDFDVLSAHASKVERISADVGLAQSAAGSMNLGGGAFGLMCSFLVPPVGLVSAMAQDAIRAGAGMVERSAQGIREVAGEFQAFEDEARAVFDGIAEGELGGSAS